MGIRTALGALLGGCVSTSASVAIDDTAPEGVEPLPLCVNEFVADNETGWSGSDGAVADWIELHNPTSEPVWLEDFALSDDPDDPIRFDFDPSLYLAPAGYLVLWADGQPELGPTHLPFALSAEGEAIVLTRRADRAGEVLAYGAVETDFAWSRTPDCCTPLPECATQSWKGTPGETNGVTP